MIEIIMVIAILFIIALSIICYAESPDAPEGELSKWLYKRSLKACPICGDKRPGSEWIEEHIEARHAAPVDKRGYWEKRLDAVRDARIAHDLKGLKGLRGYDAHAAQSRCACGLMHS